MPAKTNAAGSTSPEGIGLLIVETGDSTEILPADRAIIEISAKGFASQPNCPPPAARQRR